MHNTILGLIAMVAFMAASTAGRLMAAEENDQAVKPPAVKNPPANQSDEAKPEEVKPEAAKPGETKPEEAAADEKEKPKEPDPFIVPEGTPAELKAFIDKVRKTRITSPLMMLKARMALIRAAEHIIAAQPEEKEVIYAVQLKSQLLPDREHLDEFAEELKVDGFDKYARLVRSFRLQVDLALAEREEPENRKTVIDNVLKFLEESPPEAADARLALMAGKIAEMTGDDKYASEVYFAAARSFALAKDKELVEFAQTMAGTSRRLALQGNEIHIDGFLLNGEKFDWSKYQGKVVLVDFWTTWSGSSVADLRKMEQYYEAYHDQGFEIVGVSCDKEIEELKKFLARRKLPWTIVYGKDGPSPSVQYYGITNIPTKILVGRDGKVISLNARGRKLKQELQNIFGPADEN
ncbi:MAG: redoxin domain-containing protein [Pirellulaceae bacterium]|nr:redoxin domain-containing protein [Pirellulaceae bacterium]